MSKQIEESIEAFGEKLKCNASSPAVKHLHTVSELSIELDEEKSNVFHSIVTNLLHTCKRGRPDIEPTVYFLCTRVSKSTEEDWEKLKLLILFLQQTITDPRIIGGNSVDGLSTWINST